MSVLTYAYRLHPVTGVTQHRSTDAKDMPRMIAEGWYDSPEKVPGSVEQRKHLEAAAALAVPEWAEQTFSARPDEPKRAKRA